MPPLFRPEQFVPTRFSTQADKARFADQFVRFVRSDFAWSHFPEWFYRRLSDTFGHIAHYNRRGFYETFFLTTADKIRFLRLTHAYPGYGDPAWTWCDVERVIQSWLAVEGTLVRYTQSLQVEVELQERAVALTLVAKYPDLLPHGAEVTP